MPDASTHPMPPRFMLFEYSELNPAFRDNPHTLLDPQRSARPVEHDGMLSAVLITSYAAGRETLRDAHLSRNFNNAAPNNPVIANVRRLNEAVEAEFGRHDSIVTLDGADHTRVRTIIAEAFLKRAAALQATVARIIAERLDALTGRDTFDVVADYAAQIPMRVLGALMGCPDAALDDLKRWTEAGQLAFDPTKSAEQEHLALEGRRGIFGHFRLLMAERRAEPRDDLVSDLLAAQARGAPIDDNEILHNLFAVLVAGHLTTADLIGNGVALLLDHREARDAILADPGLIQPAVEEILRHEPPISFTARFPKTEGAIARCPYHAGDALVVSLIATNRDPDTFDDPHRFDITRRPNPHMAFGAGAHICLGAPLARMEGQMALLKLFERFPNLRRVEAPAPEWRAVPGVRGLACLNVATG
ncbi:Polyketide biosynthesis cytochrome P450 PksS [Asticcacaulis sp. MM231]|uniref:cytochrome P450 n=1 Tax=Asticcacaulis sp. MM231 TaxID=3157666 RepID=UPI0032D5AA56